MAYNKGSVVASFHRNIYMDGWLGIATTVLGTDGGLYVVVGRSAVRLLLTRECVEITPRRVGRCRRVGH